MFYIHLNYLPVHLIYPNPKRVYLAWFSSKVPRVLIILFYFILSFMFSTIFIYLLQFDIILKIMKLPK